MPEEWVIVDVSSIVIKREQQSPSSNFFYIHSLYINLDLYLFPPPPLSFSSSASHSRPRVVSLIDPFVNQKKPIANAETGRELKTLHPGEGEEVGWVGCNDPNDPDSTGITTSSSTDISFFPYPSSCLSIKLGSWQCRGEKKAGNWQGAESFIGNDV